MKLVKTYALVRDASGRPDIIEQEFTMSHGAYNSGVHYKEIESFANDNGYVFIAAFDENDPAAGAILNAAGRHANTEADLADTLASALLDCVEQVHQMKGMFDDEDGAIQAALDSADLALSRFNRCPVDRV